MRKQLPNNYVINFTAKENDLYEVDSVKYWDVELQIDKDYLGYIEIPEGDLTFDELYVFIQEIQRREEYLNTNRNVLDELLSNFSSVKVMLSYDMSGSLFIDNEGEDYELITATKVEKNFYVVANMTLFGVDDFDETLNLHEYMDLITVVLQKWYKNT